MSMARKTDFSLCARDKMIGKKFQIREDEKKRNEREKTMTTRDMITDFIFVEDELEKADAILIPGSNEGSLAVHAADLYREGYAPLVIPSGKYSILQGKFLGAAEKGLAAEKSYETESDYLAAVLMEHGVPQEAIWKEREATYTYENAIFTRKLLERNKRVIRTAILSCKAYHARRCLMYYQLLFPEVKLIVSPVVTNGISRENWDLDDGKIDIVLGEMERCGSQFHEIFKEKISRR